MLILNVQYNQYTVNKNLRWLTVFITIIVLTGLVVGYAQAQSFDENGRFFPETGHTVSGAFLEKYNSIPNGKEIYGNPITDAFEDDSIGYMVQYFEKARFELHPEKPADLQVQLTPLGEFLYQPGEEAPDLFNFASCTSFSETEFEVCYDFLDFFEANGGLIQFGYPISDIELHNGWFSQYFQRVRLEWHPELHQGEKIIIADLGIDYFNFQGENTRHLQPNQGIGIPIQDISRLRVHAFVDKPIISVAETTQTLYIIVYDQNYKAIENVFLNYLITLPSGGTIEGRMTQTDRNGLSYQAIRLNGLSIGTAEITVTATIGTIQHQTQASFQIW